MEKSVKNCVLWSHGIWDKVYTELKYFCSHQNSYILYLSIFAENALKHHSVTFFEHNKWKPSL